MEMWASGQTTRMGALQFQPVPTHGQARPRGPPKDRASPAQPKDPKDPALAREPQLRPKGVDKSFIRHRRGHRLECGTAFNFGG